MSKNRNELITLSSRIKELREKMHVSQGDFSIVFSAYIGKDTPYSVMTISNWETGRKTPPSDILIQLCRFYGVTLDYLFGISDIEDGYKQEKIDITPDDFYRHIGKPIIMKIGRKEEWVLIASGDELIDSSGRFINGNYSYRYLISQSLYEKEMYEKEKCLPIKEIYAAETVKVKSLLRNQEAADSVNGWYRHSEDKTYLESLDNGRRLYYSEYGITFICTKCTKV